MNITYPKKKKPEIIYKDVIKNVEKIVIVEKIIERKRPKAKKKVIFNEPVKVKYPVIEPRRELVNVKS